MPHLRGGVFARWALLASGSDFYVLRFQHQKRAVAILFSEPLLASAKQISLRPEAVFEVFGKHKSIVITACDRPIFPPSIAIPPAIPAPAEYADTIQRFSRSGRLQSPTEPNISDSTDTDKMTTVPGRLTETRNTSRHEHNSRKTYSKRYRKHKPEEAASVRVRRGAVIPGTTAHRHPNDPDPVEPFAIAVEHGGVIAMELVVHQGRSKRAYRTAVLGRRVEQAPAWMEAGARAACRTEVQGVVGATEEWKGDEMVMEGGRGRGCGNTPTALPTGRQDGLPGTGRGGCHGGRNRKRRKSDGDGERRQGVGCLGGEGRNTTDGNQQNIVVVVAEEEALDGVHGAPVFVGGQLFGFAIQVHEVFRHLADHRYIDMLESYSLQIYYATQGTTATSLKKHKNIFFTVLLLHVCRSSRSLTVDASQPFAVVHNITVCGKHRSVWASMLQE